MHRVMHRVDNDRELRGRTTVTQRLAYAQAPATALVLPPQVGGLSSAPERMRRYIKHAANIPSIPDGTHGGFPIAFPSVVSTASLSLDGRGRFDDAGFSLADINIPIPGPHREGRKRPSDMVRVKEAAGLQQAINKPSPCRHYSGCRWAASG